jgi:hypothetical protein
MPSVRKVAAAQARIVGYVRPWPAVLPYAVASPLPYSTVPYVDWTALKGMYGRCGSWKPYEAAGEGEAEAKARARAALAAAARKYPGPGPGDAALSSDPGLRLGTAPVGEVLAEWLKAPSPGKLMPGVAAAAAGCGAGWSGRPPQAATRVVAVAAACEPLAAATAVGLAPTLPPLAAPPPPPPPAAAAGSGTDWSAVMRVRHRSARGTWGEGGAARLTAARCTTAAWWGPAALLAS